MPTTGQLWPRISGGGGGGTAFTPASITSAVGWCRANTLALASGAAVPSVTDVIAGTYPLTQATSGNRPTFDPVGINGKPAIVFNGVSQWMQVTGLNTPLASAAWIWAVLQMDADPNATGGKTGLWEFTSSVSFSAHHPFTDGTVYESALNSSRQTIGNPYPSLAAPHTWAIAASSAGWSARLNNGLVFSTASNIFSPPGATSYVGRRAANDYFLAGKLAEIVWGTAPFPTATEWLQLEVWANTEYATG